MVRKAFAGLVIGTQELVVEPRLPSAMQPVRFRVHYQGSHVAVDTGRDGIRLDAHECEAPHALQISVDGPRAVVRRT